MPAFAVIAAGLMAAFTPALLSAPWVTAGWALLAFAICYLLSFLTLLAIGTGNRNITIFQVALPPKVMAPLMRFLGAWQLPMYLTPILLLRLYTRALHNE